MFSLISVKLLCVAVCFTTLINVSQQYGDGAPTDSCSDMIPQHGVSPKTDKMPYTVTLNKKSIKPGEKLTITLNSLDKPLKGFLVEIRDSANGPAIGSFDSVNGAKLLNCGLRRKNNAITHISSVDKPKVVLTWTAPTGTLKGPIKAYVTIVQTWDVFWVGQESESITVTK